MTAQGVAASALIESSRPNLLRAGDCQLAHLLAAPIGPADLEGLPSRSMSRKPKGTFANGAACTNNPETSTCVLIVFARSLTIWVASCPLADGISTCVPATFWVCA